MAERTAEDVKLRPMPGDEAHGSKSIRIVGAIFTNGEIGFTYWLRGRGIYGSGNTSAEGWRKWAATAEVIHIAQPKEKTDGE